MSDILLKVSQCEFLSDNFLQEVAIDTELRGFILKLLVVLALNGCSTKIYDPVVKTWGDSLLPDREVNSYKTVYLQSVFGTQFFSDELNTLIPEGSLSNGSSDGSSMILDKIAQFLFEKGFEVEAGGGLGTGINILLNGIVINFERPESLYTAHLEITLKVSDTEEMLGYDYYFSREIISDVPYPNYFSETLIVRTLSDAITHAILRINNL